MRGEAGKVPRLVLGNTPFWAVWGPSELAPFCTRISVQVWIWKAGHSSFARPFPAQSNGSLVFWAHLARARTHRHPTGCHLEKPEPRQRNVFEVVAT